MNGDSEQFERAMDALDQCLTKLEAAQEASVSVQMKKEQEAVEELADTLADAFAKGLNSSEGRFAAAVADVSRLNKTEAKSLIARKVQEAEADFGNPLNVWIADNLEEVRVMRTTDHVQDSRYVWDFGGVTVETASGEGRRAHFSWMNFRDAIYETGGPYLDDPQPSYRDGKDWRDFIVNQEKANGVEKVATGPRTNAVDYLKKRVRNADGFGNLEDAGDMQGVYVEVNNDPPEGVQPVNTDDPEQECPKWRVEMLMIPNEWAKDAAEEYDISTRALQNELDARGYTLEGQTSVSSQEYLGGRYETFWTLSGDFAAPAAYQTEAESPDGDGEGKSAAERNERSIGDGDLGAVGGGDE